MSQNENNADCGCTLQQTSELRTTPVAAEWTGPYGAPADKVDLCSELTEIMDEDDLPTEPTLHSVDQRSKPSPALLREIDQDGNEIVINDHRTSAGFTFRNTLMFELD